MTTGAGRRDVLDAFEADAEEPSGRRPEPRAARLEEPEGHGAHADHRDTPAPAVTTTRPPRPLIVAHRGAAAIAPEHTIPAYEAAVAAGADALWLDVQETADEQLVVVHDDRLERTTNGRGPVRERTVRELKRLDAGRWFGWRFRGQRIQTLSEVLERFRDRAGFVVALRAGSDVFPGHRGARARAAASVRCGGPDARGLLRPPRADALPRARRGHPPRGVRRGPAPRRRRPSRPPGGHRALPRRRHGSRAGRGRGEATRGSSAT